MTAALIDTHCHLYWDDFHKDLPEVLERAKQAGVGHFVVIGIDPATCRKAVELAQQYDFVFASVGVHPNDCGKQSAEELAAIEALLTHPKVVGVGETGLDFYRDATPRAAQEESFLLHMKWAEKHKLPLIVHCRDAYDACAELLEKHMQKPVRGVMHCWGGTPQQAVRFVKLGMHISFAGNVTYKNAQQLQDAARKVPLERVVVETDCPWLAPAPHRGKRNEPAFVRDTAVFLAGLHEISVDDIARITTRNASELFGLGLHTDERTIVYPIRDSLYVNLTNRCSAHCVFCPIYDAPYVKGHYLGMKQEAEPEAAEVLQAIGDPAKWKEIVFCGFGEPTLKWEILKQVARGVKGRGGRVRLNTNGHGNLIHNRDITPEMKGLIDSVSISLNASNAEDYYKIVRPQFGPKTFDAVKEFIIKAQRQVPDVTASIVGIPNLDAAECEQLSKELGAAFRNRAYNTLG